MNDLEAIFGLEGGLAKHTPAFRARPGQLALAQAIETTIAKRGVLVAEAGTGTGKTLAYLVPAILSGAKVLVSTGTRTLQDQLFGKDLPLVRQALALPLVTALLKGRANYVCHHHLERLQDDPEALRSRNEITWLRQIRQFAATSTTGDRATLSSVPEEADIWNRVTSTRENCLGQECPQVRECFVYKARREAQEADLVVINHALFMADAALKQEGISDLLPEADVVIFDEAHQLPAVATRFLGQSISTGQLQDLARQSEAAGLAHAREALKWSQLSEALTRAIKEWRLSCDWIDQSANRRAMPEDILQQPDALAAFAALCDALERLLKALCQHEEQHPDIAALARTAQTCQVRLYLWQQVLLVSDGAASDGMVYWLENTSQHVRFNVAPLSITEAFSLDKKGLQAWVFLSATLSVKGDFSHFVDRLGLEELSTHRQPSPFDYQRSGLLCVPSDLPAVNHPDYSAAFAKWIFPVIVQNDGATLVLCTTLRAVDRVAQALEQLYAENDLQWPILRQGAQPRGALLNAFREQDHAVLVGSATFWEGIDVVGERLTLVAIDKLPFAPPDDPILQARLKACRDKGGNPFIEFQVPEAAIALKQGAGRLIRSEQDWGVLIVGDSRLVDKPYGRALWQGLPAFQRTRQVQEVLDFIAARRQDA